MEPKPSSREEYIVVVQRTKPRRKIYFRAMPRTAYDPTPAQIMARIMFGEIARKAKGKKFTDKHGLPPAALMVKKLLSGKKFYPHIVRDPKWLQTLKKLAREMGYAIEIVEKLREVVMVEQS